MDFPQLYSRTSTGAIQTWRIEVFKNEYRTITGQLDGKQVISEWTVCSGKNIGRSNETSAEEQAVKDAKSIWDKKKKSKGYWEDIKMVDGSTFVEPMLAKKFVDRLSKVKYPVMVDRKYNGMRDIIIASGQYTRNGEEIHSAPHIHEALNNKDIFSTYPEIVIDGELYNHEYRYSLNEFISLVRKTKNITAEDISKSEQLVKYYVYDGYNFIDSVGRQITQDTPCSIRRVALKELLQNVPYIRVVDFMWADSEADVWKIYEEYVADGYEGAMVRADAKYENKRSNNLLKLKPVDSDEGVILDVNEGSGNWSGIAKTVELNWGGKRFKASFKGSQDEGRKFLKNKYIWLGKTVTFTYNGLTGLGIPNYAQLDINNCLRGD